MVNQRKKPRKIRNYFFDFTGKLAFFLLTVFALFSFIFKMENLFPTFLKINQDALNLIGSPKLDFDVYLFQSKIDSFYLLYTQYSYLFILVGFVLLVSMICAISLSLNSLKKKNDG
jgi:NADH:ubiquinone oxidoreductase subunit 6 (subunit J)